MDTEEGHTSPNFVNLYRTHLASVGRTCNGEYLPFSMSFRLHVSELQTPTRTFPNFVNLYRTHLSSVERTCNGEYFPFSMSLRHHVSELQTLI